MVTKEILSTSVCEKTGLTITTYPKWIVDDEKGNVIISLIDANIIRIKYTGCIKLFVNKKVETIVDQIIGDLLPGNSRHIQILDLLDFDSFSFAAKLNHIKQVKRRKNSLAQIYYGASTRSKLSIRLSRKFNRLTSGIHIVNDYEEAIKVAQKLLSSELPAD